MTALAVIVALATTAEEDEEAEAAEEGGSGLGDDRQHTGELRELILLAVFRDVPDAGRRLAEGSQRAADAEGAAVGLVQAADIDDVPEIAHGGARPCQVEDEQAVEVDRAGTEDGVVYTDVADQKTRLGRVGQSQCAGADRGIAGVGIGTGENPSTAIEFVDVEYAWVRAVARAITDVSGEGIGLVTGAAEP